MLEELLIHCYYCTEDYDEFGVIDVAFSLVIIKLRPTKWVGASSVQAMKMSVYLSLANQAHVRLVRKLPTNQRGN